MLLYTVRFRTKLYGTWDGTGTELGRDWNRTGTGLEQDFERNIIKQDKNRFCLSPIPVFPCPVRVLSQSRPSSIQLSSETYCKSDNFYKNYKIFIIIFYLLIHNQKNLFNLYSQTKRNQF